jgi:hypothetical protein
MSSKFLKIPSSLHDEEIIGVLAMFLPAGNGEFEAASQVSAARAAWNGNAWKESILTNSIEAKG